MKTLPLFLFATLLAAGTFAAFAQDDRKPAPADPPPAPDARIRSADPNTAPPPAPPVPPIPPTPPGPEGRHGEHHGDHHFDGWHHSPGPWPPTPPRPTSYLGVITTTPPAVLTAQLGLDEGFGLVVMDVLPDSPAATAGIQRYDVLTKFNDQQLVDPGQFSTLVRALKKDADATLTLIRKAAPQTVSVKIGERLLPERHSFPALPEPRGFPGPGNFRSGGPVSSPGENDQPGEVTRDYAKRVETEARHFQERAQNFNAKMRDFQERMKAWQKNPSAEMPPVPQLPPAENIPAYPKQSSQNSAPSIAPEDILRETRPGGAAELRFVQPNATVTYNIANAKLLMKDETGEIELTTHDGKRSLVARDGQGETVFEGPIDTDQQRKALPEEVRKKLELIERQRRLAEAPRPPFGETRIEPDVQ